MTFEGSIVTEVGELKQRVDHAVEQIVLARNTRRKHQDSLVQLLADLEVKFDARHDELAYCRSRISDLEQANVQLGEMLTNVIQLIESGAVDEPDDPIHRAAKIAAGLVSLFTRPAGTEPRSRRDDTQEAEVIAANVEVIEEAPTDFLGMPVDAASDLPGQQSPARRPAPAPQLTIETPAHDTFEIDLDEPEAPPAAPMARAKSTTQVPIAAEYSIMGDYEDVSREELDVEALLDDGLDFTTLPPVLVQAIDAAKADDGVAMVMAEVSDAVEAIRRADHAIDIDDEMLDVPGIDNTAAFDFVDGKGGSVPGLDGPPKPASSGGDSDIRALMERIESAAEKARDRSGNGQGDTPDVVVPSSTPGKTGTH